MANLTPIWSNFNAGELSPLMEGRTDQEKYFSGCSVLENFIPTVQGPLVRRGGSRYLGGVQGNERAWLVPFEFSTAQSYVLELTEEVMRFWVNRGQLLDEGVPYEIPTPWTNGDLVTSEGTFGLRTVQSADVMWMCLQSGAKRPQKLSRLGATDWSLDDAPFPNGPFAPVDPDSTITVTASGVTGLVSLTASADLFRPSDVGTPFYLEDVDYLEVPTWEPDKTVTLGGIWRYEGNVYEVVSIGSSPHKTGTFPPVHLEGDATDGVGGVKWRYLHSGYGWGNITLVNGPRSVFLNVTKRFPEGVTSGTNRWARSAFNDTDGWPTDVTFFRERLVYVRGRSVYASVVGDYDNFTRKDGPDITKETALILDLTSDRVDSIRWCVGSKQLLLGTSRSELSIHEQTPQQVFAADNATNTPQSEYGSRLLPPLRVGSNVLFLQRSGRKLREMRYDINADGYVAEDMNILSEHILDGVVDMDFQQEPNSVVWCAGDDGKLAALTYDRERGVIAWHNHILGGEGPNSDHAIVESVACIAAPDGRRDDVWLSVRRQIGETVVRYIEVLEDNTLAERQGLPYAFYPDCGISRPGGSPTTTITGLDHLEGATVQVLADGNPHPDREVVDGEIELQFPASVVHVGFNSPARMRTMRLDAGAQGGTAQTLKKSLAEVYLRFHKTLGGKAGPAFDRLDAISYSDARDLIGAPLVLFSGDKELTWPATYDTDGYVCVQQDQLLPMTLSAIIGRLDIGEGQ